MSKGMAKRAIYGTAGFCWCKGHLCASAVPGAQEGKGKVRALWHIRQGRHCRQTISNPEARAASDGAGEPSGTAQHMQCPEAEPLLLLYVLMCKLFE
jgi:hypothetical protein